MIDREQELIGRLTELGKETMQVYEELLEIYRKRREGEE